MIGRFTDYGLEFCVNLAVETVTFDPEKSYTVSRILYKNINIQVQVQKRLFDIY